VLPFGLAHPKEQLRLLQQLSLFYLLPFLRKKLGELGPWTHLYHGTNLPRYGINTLYISHSIQSYTTKPNF
jgi:hypothetical protein